MKARSFSCQAIVLKRTSVGETDRMVTLLSQEFGKFTAVAKGVRKLTSSKRAVLEPGNHVKSYCLVTKSLPLLTQATLITDTATARDSLSKMKQLHQLLEILDRLFVETELELSMFETILQTRSLILDSRPSLTQVRHNLEQLIADLGFQHPQESTFDTLSEYVAALTDSKVRSFEFLTPKT